MLEYNLAEDIDPEEEEDLCEAGAKPGRANVHTGLTPAPKSFAPEPRVIQSIEKATEEPQVPRELQGFGPDSTEDYMEARREQGLSRLQGQMGLAWLGMVLQFRKMREWNLHWAYLLYSYTAGTRQTS